MRFKVTAFAGQGPEYEYLPSPQRTGQGLSVAPDNTSEDDGLVAVLDDAVLAVPPHGTGQGGAFDVGAQSRQVPDRVAVIDPDDVLLDDRPVVEFFGHVVSSRADELDSSLLSPPVRGGADERRQEGVVDIDHRAADLVEELRR